MMMIFAILAVLAVALTSFALVIRERARALAVVYRDESALPTHACNTQSLKRLAERTGRPSVGPSAWRQRRIRTYCSSHIPSWAPHH